MAWNVFKKSQSTDDTTPSSQKEKTAVVAKKVAPAREEKTVQLPGKKFSVRESAILVRPIVTEKSLIASGKHVYMFEVALRATKISIKKAFFNLYGVMPTGARTITMAGKEVRFGQRKGRRKDWKKAYITVPKDKTIDI